MTGRTTLPTHDLDQLVPVLTKQGLDPERREFVLEVTETRTVIRRITVRPAAPEPITTPDQKETTSWQNAEPR